MYESLKAQNYSVKLTGIALASQENYSSNWTNNNDAAVCVDPSPYNTWNDWNANQRDLFILDRNGNFISQQNITSGLPSDLESTVIALLTEDAQQTYVPDDNFEQALIDLGYDDELDDYVLTDNISSVTSLNVSESNIASLEGISDFTSLNTLYCYMNSLTELDLSNNIALTTLHSTYNQLTSIDLSNNIALTHLYLDNNQLASLDVSQNTSLEVLYSHTNPILNLDVSANTLLDNAQV